MCLSAKASFIAAAILISTGVATAFGAWRGNRRYLAVGILPLLFGLQQLAEGLVWTAGKVDNARLTSHFSLIYMFFSWMVWPVWVPISAYFLETGNRRHLLLGFAVAGGMLGGLQYVPYLVHEGWLTTLFLEWAVRYQDVNLLDALVRREVIYVIYSVIIIVPFFIVRDKEIKVFGTLIAGILIVTYVFFSYAYISVFCFGGAIASFYLVILIWRNGRPDTLLQGAST